jgi:hypothetical protein
MHDCTGRVIFFYVVVLRLPGQKRLSIFFSLETLLSFRIVIVNYWDTLLVTSCRSCYKDKSSKPSRSDILKITKQLANYTAKLIKQMVR